MSTKAIQTLEVNSRQEWRNWLKDNADSQSEIWLVFRKHNTDVKSLDYMDTVEEALCFGWIDSLVRRLDDERYARKFTPRKVNSKWSTINRRLYKNLKSRGLLAPPGLKRAPTDWNGDAPRPSMSMIPSYIRERIKSNPRAYPYFEKLAPTYRRAYIVWIDSAKREKTKEKRLREAISLLEVGKKLGLK